MILRGGRMIFILSVWAFGGGIEKSHAGASVTDTQNISVGVNRVSGMVMPSAFPGFIHDRNE